MSTVNQIYALINEVAKQTFGESAVTVTDTSTLVALGDKVLSSDVDTDKFAKTLVDRIGRTIFSIRRYTASGDDGLVKEPFEYGCIVQKIYVDLPEAKEKRHIHQLTRLLLSHQSSRSYSKKWLLGKLM